jgi:hypothetical protein
MPAVKQPQFFLRKRLKQLHFTIYSVGFYYIMFSRSSQLVGKSIFQRGKVLAKASKVGVRFLSVAPSISKGPQSVLTSKEIDQIVNNLPPNDVNKLLIEKLKSLKNDSYKEVESQPISPVVDVEQTHEKLNSFLTRFIKFRTGVSETDRAEEVTFVAKLLDLLKNDSIFSEAFLSKFQVADLINHIVLQSVLKPGGNHCPDEYFGLLFSIVNKSKSSGVDIWGFAELDKFFNGEQIIFCILYRILFSSPHYYLFLVTTNGNSLVQFLMNEKRYEYQTDWETMCREIIRAGEASDIDDYAKESGLSFIRGNLNPIKSRMRQMGFM